MKRIIFFNIALNLLAGGTCIEHLEHRRNDEASLDALGAERIPDPTTAGDFCRRFDSVDAQRTIKGKNPRHKRPKHTRKKLLQKVVGEVALARLAHHQPIVPRAEKVVNAGSHLRRYLKFELVCPQVDKFALIQLHAE